jgi:hypothetical protein
MSIEVQLDAAMVWHAGEPERRRTMRTLIAVMGAGCLASLLLAGCGRNPTPPPQSGGTFVLYSIDPDREPKDEQEAAAADAAGERFRGFYVRGSAAINDPAERAKLLDALRDGIANNDGAVAACFNPRHGIRAGDGGPRVDYLICFECRHVHVFEAGKPQRYAVTSDAPAAVFNAQLKAHGLPAPR